MVEERAKFVWEKSIYVDLVKARKEREYKAMKERYELIEEAIQNLSEILNLAEKAEEYGVFEYSDNWYGAGEMAFQSAHLYIAASSIAKKTGKNTEEIKTKGWKELLYELIGFEDEQEKQMEQYFEEAEPYLVVEVKMGQDDENGEDP